MHILRELQERIRPALVSLIGNTEDLKEILDMVRQSQNPAFGDYQANFAMSLAKRVGKPPMQIAEEVVAKLRIDDLCESVEVAKPGFINLRLRDSHLTGRLAAMTRDERLGIEPVTEPRTVVVDYSAPNVAKPMHVGHIRSTVIGDSICRTLRFLGHAVISDNHIGDWGTQFGMIIYGYRRFLDESAYREQPVHELARLYRLVRRLMDYHEAKRSLPEVRAEVARQEEFLGREKAAAGDKPDKKTRKNLGAIQKRLEEAVEAVASKEKTISAVEADAQLKSLAEAHCGVGEAVLRETAKLHAGDEENLRLWREFLPACEDEMDRVYRRLGVSFDHTLGESFYNNRLRAIVEELTEKGVARESEGAVCVFLEGEEAPMLIRKRDGAFLYATTDLATIRYRMEEWHPDAVLYVVDHRQSLHFRQLFAAARLMGCEKVDLRHIVFGTVLGSDGKPFKTRAGDTVGLESLLDEAVRRASEIVAENDDAKPAGGELSEEERATIAERVGIAALKYADLSQNRDSDYVFSYDKMLAMNGNTATYMQYAYARVRSIFNRGGFDPEALRASGAELVLETDAERALALEILRFGEALELAVADYRPNILTAYLFELANRYSRFFDQCPVLKAQTNALRDSRLLLCDLTARTIRKGLELLGIETVERM